MITGLDLQRQRRADGGLRSPSANWLGSRPSGRGGDARPVPPLSVCARPLCRPRTDFFRCILHAADAGAAALAQGCDTSALVRAYHLAVHGFDGAGLGGQNFARKSLNLRSPMKQIPVESFFLAVTRSSCSAMLAHLRLLQIPDREQALTHLGFAQSVGSSSDPCWYQAAQQARAAGYCRHGAHSGRWRCRWPQLFGGKFEERFELDLLICTDIRFGVRPALVLFEEVLEHVVPSTRRRS